MADIHSEFVDLFQAARRGDQDARESLVERVRPRLERFVERHMGVQVRRRAEPADIVQATVLTLFARIGTYREDLVEDEVLSYVLQIARWRIADVLKKGLREHGESQLPERDPASDAPSVGPVTRADDARWTRQQIDSLPDLYASVLRHFYVDGRSVAETAALCDLSPNLVKQRLARGRDLLRQSNQRA